MDSARLFSVCVCKFGGASAKTPRCYHKIAKRIASHLVSYDKVLVVVSAMYGVTDALFDLASHVHPNPPKRELDMLVTTGERISMSLLAMAFDFQQIKAQSFTGSQSGIITTSSHADAQIVRVKPWRILQCFKTHDVAIVAGFQGVSEEGEITTLRRGGSDASAVALAHALGTEHVYFYKDVDGIYSKDPKIDENAEHISHMSYAQAIECVDRGAAVLQKEALELARRYQIPLRVLSFDPIKTKCTLVQGGTE